MKNANPSMSVCEVGASIGRLWREMSDADKQHYNDDFSREKVDFSVLNEYVKLRLTNCAGPKLEVKWHGQWS